MFQPFLRFYWHGGRCGYGEGDRVFQPFLRFYGDALGAPLQFPPPGRFQPFLRFYT